MDEAVDDAVTAEVVVQVENPVIVALPEHEKHPTMFPVVAEALD